MSASIRRVDLHGACALVRGDELELIRCEGLDRDAAVVFTTPAALAHARAIHAGFRGTLAKELSDPDAFLASADEAGLYVVVDLRMQSDATIAYGVLLGRHTSGANTTGGSA